MDAVEFLKTQKRMCKKYHSEKDADIKDFFKGCEKCPLWKFCTENEDLDCEKCVEVVENWAEAHPVITLTEQQKTAIRGRIAEGWKWIAFDEPKNIWFYEEKPKKSENKKMFYNDSLVGSGEEARSKIYNFVTFENSPIYLPGLLGDEE